MAFYEVTSESFLPVPDTTFAAAGIRERADLQRLLRAQIDIIAKDTLIVAEEFGEWEESSRRIDLLGLDQDANLVVFELKTTEDGGHMELQAIRYAAMVSTMTFEKVEEVYGRYLGSLGKEADARYAILGFLRWEAPQENLFAQNVRIVIVSADFSKEITTSVMWLNKQGLDIQCVRIKPYSDHGRVFVDVQQIIPLPEAAEYQVRIKEKQERERVARETSKDYTKYDVTAGGTLFPRLNKRMAIFRGVKYLCDSGVAPEAISKVNGCGANRFRSADTIIGSKVAFIECQKEQEFAGGKSFDASRYFCEDDQLLHSGGTTWTLSNQWGTQTSEFISELIKAFPEKEIVCTPSA